MSEQRDKSLIDEFFRGNEFIFKKEQSFNRFTNIANDPCPICKLDKNLMRWISVEYALPESNKLLVVAIRNKVLPEFADFREDLDNSFFSCENGQKLDNVLYWLRMPPLVHIQG